MNKILKKQSKRLLLVFCAILMLISALPISAFAVMVNGQNYYRDVPCYAYTASFGSYQGISAYSAADQGNTANLIGESQGIGAYGDWFNWELGRDTSMAYGVGRATAGTEAGHVLISNAQFQSSAGKIGFRGRFESPYRGVNRQVYDDYYSAGSFDNLSGQGVVFGLKKNMALVEINGLDASDQSNTTIEVFGSNLPNPTSYGSSSTFYDSNKGGYSRGDLCYGKYSVKINIPNSEKYNISHKITYITGSKFEGQGDTESSKSYLDTSGLIEVNPLYMESGGSLVITVTCTPKATTAALDVVLMKESAVKPTVDGKTVSLYRGTASTGLQFVGTLKTDASGKARFSGLSFGMYTIKVSPIADCVLDPGETVEVNVQRFTTKIIWMRTVKRNITVNLVKEDGVTASIANQSFKLAYIPNILKPNETVDKGTLKTDASGRLTFSKLEQGSYTVEMINPPSGCFVDSGGSAGGTKRSFYLKNSDQECTYTLRRGYDLSVSLTKSVGVTESLYGHYFELYKGNSTNAKDLIATKNTSLLGGNPVFKGLAPGDYTVRKAVVGPNYAVEPAQTIQVHMDMDKTVRFNMITTDPNAPGKMTIYYTNEDARYAGYNIHYLITYPDGTQKTKTSYDGSVLGLDASSPLPVGDSILGDNLTPGTYTIEQLDAPEGYAKVDGPQTFEVVAGQKTQAIFYNPILYDFSVRIDLPEEAQQGSGPVKGTVYFTNNSSKPARNVPVMIEGMEIDITTIAIPANYTITKEIEFSTDEPGLLHASAWINLDNEFFGTKYEVNKADNEAEAQCMVKGTSDLTVDFIPPNSEYTEGDEVVSTFRVSNTGTTNITPDMRLTVDFTAEIAGQTIRLSESNVIIPWDGSNLAIFKWRVPEGAAGETATISARVNSDRAVIESDYGNNTASVERKIHAVPRSETPDTKYERGTPAYFRYVDLPQAESNPEASWSIWTWKNGWFEKQAYTAKLTDGTILCENDPKIPIKADPSKPLWTRSGYGLRLTGQVRINTAAPNVVTGVQNAQMFFPEFQYSQKQGDYRTLDVSPVSSGLNSCPLPVNRPYDDRLHFTPIWFKDGDYVVTATLSSVWTPAGMLWINVQNSPVDIRGNMYDDWYVR